jgi:hypothetical protein
MATSEPGHDVVSSVRKTRLADVMNRLPTSVDALPRGMPALPSK